MHIRNTQDPGVLISCEGLDIESTTLRPGVGCWGWERRLLPESKLESTMS